MSVLEFVQKYLIFLLPGIIGVLLYNKINIHKEQHYYLEFIKMILYSFFSFLLSDLTAYLMPCQLLHSTFSPINILKYIYSDKSELPTINIIFAILWALIISCILTKSNYNNWIFRIANKLKLTRRIDNEPVWEHFFDKGSIVNLRDLVTGNIYYGSVASFSDNCDNREIYFDDVYVYNDQAELLYHSTGLYLSRAHNEFILEIPDDEK